ncbi:MAG: Atu4866 domain-containing protein [Proteobacteria bacterium]|nr:Atu4866 domain-containing protein [Pseudomonadota bacterium]
MAVHAEARFELMPTPLLENPAVEASGEWVSLRNTGVRLFLTSDGRYAKHQGVRMATHSGRYSRRGREIRFVDEFDFVMVGEISNDTLKIGEYTYRRA